MKNDFYEESFEFIKFILSSNIRLKILLYLYSESHKLDEIALELGKNITNISRTIKELMEKEIIEKSGKNYCLTESGFLIAMTIKNLFNKWSSIEDNTSFWEKHVIKSHDISFINHFQCLKNSKIIYSDNVNFNKTLDIYLDYLKKARTLKVILPIFSNIHLNAFLNVISNNNAALELITTKDILEVIEESSFSKTFNKLRNEEKIKVYLSDDIHIFLTVSDNFSSLFLFLNDDYFDESSMVLSENKKCLKELEEIFNFYK